MFDWIVQHYFQILQCVAFAVVMAELSAIRDQLQKANRSLAQMRPGTNYTEINTPVPIAANQDR